VKCIFCFFGKHVRHKTGVLYLNKVKISLIPAMIEARLIEKVWCIPILNN